MSMASPGVPRVSKAAVNGKAHKSKQQAATAADKPGTRDGNKDSKKSKEDLQHADVAGRKGRGTRRARDQDEEDEEAGDEAMNGSQAGMLHSMMGGKSFA